MKKLLCAIAAGLILALSSAGVIAYAVDLSEATYIGTIRITNNSTATTNVSVPFTANTSVYVGAGYMNSSANNTAVLSSGGADVRYMPAISGNTDWVAFVSSIGTNSINNDTLYMGGTADMGGLIRYFPAQGGMTTPDSATLELSDNFTYEVAGRFNTDNGTGKYIAIKEEALAIFVSPTISENISAYILDTATLIMLPDGVGSITDIANVQPPATPHWQVVDETPAAPNDADYVEQVGVGVEKEDKYTTASPSYAGTPFTVDNVTVQFRYLSMVGATHAEYTPLLELYGENTTGTLIDTTAAGGGYIAVSETLNRPGGGAWIVSDLEDLQVGIRIKAIGTVPRCSQISLLVAYNYAQAEVTATGVTSGEHTVEVEEHPVVSYNGSQYLTDTVASFRSADTSGTIAVWFRTSAVGNSLFSSADTAGALHFLNFHLRPGGELGINVFSTSNDAVRGTTNVADGKWHLGTLVSDGAAWSMYLDDANSEGIVVVVGNNNGNWFDHANSRNNIVVGAMIRNATTGYFIGSTSEVMVYSVPLTPDQISSIYNGNASTTNLVGHWTLREGAGVTAHDISVGGNDMTLTGGASWDEIFKLNIDDELRDIEDGASVPDNSVSWTFLSYTDNTSPVMHYIEYQEITINGVQQQYIEWENAAIFTDSSGNNHDATPTFRTVSSDPDVSAVLVDFAPITEARAPPFAIDIPTTGWITENFTTTGNYTSNVTASTYPGSAVITDIAVAGETPESVLTLILGCGFVLALSLFISWVMKSNQERSLLIKLITVAAGIGLLIAIAAFDQWLLYMFVMIGIAIVMAASSRTFSGTGNSGNNMLGFLSMSFVGMTMINRILEGRFLQASDISIVREVVAFQPFNVFGLFTIPVPNVAFLTRGIPALMRWDYSFFGGNAQIVQYLLYSVTAVVSFMLFVLVFGAIYQMFSRGR